MSETEIRFLIEDIKYPKLDKSIGALKIIDSILVSDKETKITLAIQNDEAFALIKKEIVGKLPDIKNLEVTLNRKQKEITYGSTQNPNNRAPYAKKVIAVTSGKGGVGKSTTSVNLAISLAQAGHKVGLLDADVYGPDIPRMMDLSDDKLQWSDDDKMLPSENFGIKMMSVGLTTPKRDTPLVWRSSVAVSALIQFLEDVAWGELDYMVIDMPPGTGDIQLTMAQELPIAAAVLVTTPQMVANDDVSRAIMMFKETGVAIGGLVENMSYFIAPDTGNRYDIFGKDGGVNTAIRYDIPFLGSIPLDMEIREMSDEGRPPVSLGRSVHKEIYCELRDKLLKVIEELN